MKVLVTGGAGFVGTNLIKRLLRDGHDVYSLDNYSTGMRENHIDGCTYYTNDVQKISAYDERFMKPDVVFHLAAIARIQPSFERPEEYIQTNFNGTYEVVKYCINNKVPLVYAGSSSKHSGRFKNPYTFSKDLGEDIITLYQQHFGLRATIARFYNVYGPYHLREGGYTTLIGAWEKRLEQNLPLVINGDGTKRRDFTHVSDIVDALIKIVELQQWGMVFELGRGKNYSVNDIASAFRAQVLYADDKPGEAQETLCTDDLAKKILNWDPKLDIIDYITQHINIQK